MSPDTIILVLSWIFGALGKWLGNGPLTGAKKWGKILAPIFAAAACFGFTKLFHADLTPDQIWADGGVLTAQSVAWFSIAKNLIQLIKSFKS